MKKIPYILTILLLVLSCTPVNNEVFDDPAHERLEALYSEYNQILLAAQNGWKMQYFPDTSRVGGYNILFKFEDDMRVTMLSDFNKEEKTSSYKFYGGQGVVLSFDSYSFLHVLADPGYYPGGLGFGGDFEMLVKQASTDSVICEGRKWKKDMILTPATAEDWSKMNELRENENRLAPAVANLPFFRNINKNGEGLATLLYDAEDRFVEYFYNDEEGNLQSGKMGVIFTREGFSLQRKINVKGTELKDFVYNEASGDFEFGENGTLAIEHESSVVFNGAWDKFYRKDGGTLAGGSNDFHELYKSIRELEPELAALQVYWNISGYRMFSFIFVYGEDTDEPILNWYHTVIGNIDSPGEDCAIFKQQIDPDTDLPLISTDPRYEDEKSRLFFEDNESAEKVRQILDLFYDPKGFTIIPVGDNNFYMISKARSNYWMMFQGV